MQETLNEPAFRRYVTFSALSVSRFVASNVDIQTFFSF
jgi:hypothetical protein